MAQTIHVNMAHFAVVKNDGFLEARALGSCVGIAVYDLTSKVAALAHPMLPDIHSANKSSRHNLAKFVNTVIDELVKEMLRRGAKKENMAAKLAGGANMFPELTKEGSMLIGKRNVEMAKKKLSGMGIPLIAEETGGCVGRTIILDVRTGKLKVRTAFYGEKEI